MSYHVYTTPGLVLRSSPYGEADKYYHIFTKDLGLILASAKSVRSESSKLRGALDDYSLGDFSFIKGNEVWKLTYANSKDRLFYSFRNDTAKREVLMRTMHLLRRLLAGEDANTELYEQVEDAITFLKNTKLSSEDLKAFECILNLRVLSQLGYKASSPKYASFLETNVWSDYVLRDAVPHLRELVTDINNAVNASQLI